MSNRAARFTQADIARAIRAVEQTGAHMAVEILTDGTIRIEPEHARRGGIRDRNATMDSAREIVL